MSDRPSVAWIKNLMKPINEMGFSDDLNTMLQIKKVVFLGQLLSLDENDFDVKTWNIVEQKIRENGFVPSALSAYKADLNKLGSKMDKHPERAEGILAGFFKNKRLYDFIKRKDGLYDHFLNIMTPQSVGLKGQFGCLAFSDGGARKIADRWPGLQSHRRLPLRKKPAGPSAPSQG